MAGEHRTTVDSVAEQLTHLSEQIRSFDFVAAVRQLECAYPGKPRVGEAVRIRDEALRLSQHISLGFQGTALHSLTAVKGVHDYRLYANFLGLLGSNGPLPLHYTEYADHRSRHNADSTFKEFLDIFNHRILSLFYRATVQFDPAVNFDRADNNQYHDFVAALCGLLPEASTHRDSISDTAKRFYPGWVGNSAKSPDGIRAIVSDYFQLPANVVEWVGEWLRLPSTSLVRLGSGDDSARLGRAFYIGRRVWSIRHKFCVQLGPLDWDTFISFNPGGERARELHDLVRNYVGDEWNWDLELLLKAGHVKPFSLDRSSRLGFNSWLCGKTGTRLAQPSVSLNKKLVSKLAY